MREEVLDTGFFFKKTKPVFASNHRFVLRNKTRTALSTEALSTTRRFFSCFVLFYLFSIFFFRTALSTTEAELADHKAKLVNYEKELVEHFFLSQKSSI